MAVECYRIIHSLEITNMDTDILYELITTLVTRDNIPQLAAEITADICTRLEIPQDAYQTLLPAVQTTLETQCHFVIFTSQNPGMYQLTERWYLLAAPCTDCKTRDEYDVLLSEYNTLVSQIRSQLRRNQTED